MSQTPIEVRNLKFEVGDDVPRHWHPAGPAVTRFLDCLSIFFPEGERFFIESVRHYEKRVTDPELLKEVRAFYGQEGVHAREHDVYNKHLRDQGLPVESMERRVTGILNFVRRTSYRRHRLAVTCALEHFTAIMADALLSDPGIMRGANPKMAALWHWHAAEENEHKAVAFDVYQQTGGRYIDRAVVMLGTTLVFLVKIVEHHIRVMAADGNLWNLREWARFWKFVLVRPGPIRKIVPLYFAYYRPSFHPWDLDNRHLLEGWKEDLATNEAYAAAH